MSRSKQKFDQLNSAQSSVFWIVSVFLSLFFVVAPFGKGLFNGYHSSFEGNIYTAILFTALIALAIQTIMYRQWSLSTHKDALAVIIWLLPLTYFLSSFQAASSHLAYNEIYIRMAWVAFFLIGAYFAKSHLGNKLLQYMIICSGYLLVIYGLMNWFGNASYQDALIQGNRLSNVFQYPNSYAAYLIAILISSIILMNAEKRRFVQFGHAFMLVPVLVSFLLTLSRGALLVLPFVVLVFLVFTSWRNQVIILVQLGLATIVSYFMFGPMTTIREELDAGFSFIVSMRGWFYMILLSVVTATIVVGIRYLADKKRAETETASIRWTNFIVPVLFVALAIAGYHLVTNSSFVVERLPEEIRTRIEGLNSETSSISSRRAFYTDSLKIFKDYPILGAGGGAWSTLYHSYKSYPYTSTQAHNFLMQYLVESGIVGLSALVLVVFYSLWLFVRDFIQGGKRKRDWDSTRLVYPMIAISILSHSVVDFDMSYLYLSALVLLALGASVAQNETPITLFQKIKYTHRSVWKKGYIGVSTGLFAVLFIVALMSQQASANYKVAQEIAEKTGIYDEFTGHLDKAMRLKPRHPEYSLFKANILHQIYSQTNIDEYLHEAGLLLDRLRKHEPYNKYVSDLEFTQLVLMGEEDKAINLITEKIDMFPWDVRFYEKAIDLNYFLGITSDDEKNIEKYFKQTCEIVYQYYNFREEAQKYVDAKKYFQLNQRSALNSAKALSYFGRYDLAAVLIEPLLTYDYKDENNKKNIRMYLAFVELSGNRDAAWLDRLLSEDLSEAKRIEELVKTNPLDWE